MAAALTTTLNIALANTIHSFLCIKICFSPPGELDKSELKVLMSKMGIEVTEKRLTELMNQYDVDQGGKRFICCVWYMYLLVL